MHRQLPRAALLLLPLCLGACASPPPPQQQPAAALVDSAAAPGTPSGAAAADRRVDDRRPDQPTTVNLLGRAIELTGSWDYSDERRRDFDLDANRARDRRVREHEIKLEARSRLTPAAEVFVQAVALQESRTTQGTAGRQRKKSLERGQSWLRLERLFDTPWALQLGRMAVTERRAWWWDEDLDAARLQFRSNTWRLDTGVARTLARVSSADRGVLPAEKGLTRWFGQATWSYARRHSLEAFWLVAQDRSGAPAVGTLFANEDATDPSDLRARWLGLRASGEFRAQGLPRLSYWLDSAHLRGRENLARFSERPDGSLAVSRVNDRRLRSWAVDVGATLIFDELPLRPSVSVGWAKGSGGHATSSLDPNFRQTGMQENKARLAGVKRLQRYGELVQPELSNLSVRTLGAGLRVLDNSSVELVAHQFRQPTASTSFAGSRLSTDPLGLNGELGQEFDLVLAFREWRQWELSFVLSSFKPGPAFAANKRSTAYGVEAGASLNF